jgi:hypothetical protein
VAPGCKASLFFSIIARLCTHSLPARAALAYRANPTGHSDAQAQNVENKTATLGPSKKFSTSAQKQHSSDKQINKIGDELTTSTIFHKNRIRHN